MTLKISLAPGECVVIGKAKVENGGDHRCTLIINGEEVILRGRRVLRERDAVTPMTRLYFVIQCMYLADDKAILNDLCLNVCREAIVAWPAMATEVADTAQLVGAERYYEALTKAYDLVERERKLLDQAGGGGKQ
jgi:flagellar protein FlbT